MKARTQDPTLEAIAFLAVPGRAERVLANHFALASGVCGGCAVHMVAWPCSMARLARTAVAARKARSS